MLGSVAASAPPESALATARSISAGARPGAAAGEALL
jgi:hypothetical protein